MGFVDFMSTEGIVRLIGRAFLMMRGSLVSIITNFGCRGFDVLFLVHGGRSCGLTVLRGRSVTPRIFR